MNTKMNYTENMMPSSLAANAILSEKMVVTVPELAEILHIGRTKAYEMVRENRIRHFKIGRDIRIPTKAIFEFLESC